MKNRISRSNPLALSVLCAIVVSGCLLSTQYVFSILREGPYRYNTVSNFDPADVDLSDDDDWNDHKDEIDRIESIRFGGRVTNYNTTADVMAMYISRTQYTSYSSLMTAYENNEEVYCVLSDMPVPAGTTPPTPVTVTAKDTDPFLNHDKAQFAKIRALIGLGQFFTYAVGGGIGAPPNFDLLFEDCLYHIAFTASR